MQLQVPTRGAIALALVCCVLFCAEPARAKKDHTELSVNTGHGSLFDPQSDYEFTEFRVNLGYPADDWIKQHLHFNTPGDWDFQISPAIALINEPEDGMEVSCAFGLRIAVPVDAHWTPYVFGATGPFYTTVDTVEQSTQFNFNSFGGFGIEYKIDENQGMSVYKYIRHFSNGGIKDPNDGVDTSSWGISYIWYH